MKLSVITPTVGRHTLHRSAQSVLRELGPHDEWLVVGDGDCPDAYRIVQDLKDSRIRYLQTHGTRQWGNAERDLGIASATGDRLVFLDDDDELARGAFAAIRRAQSGPEPMIFRMQILPWKGALLWKDPVLKSGNVGTPMLVPVRDGRIPSWHEGSGLGYGSDYSFIHRCCAAQGTPKFVRDVICIVHHTRDPIPPPTLSAGPLPVIVRGVKLIR